jgi:mRNA deadenylase 3'-5' endonuclease subunit Ccr4
MLNRVGRQEVDEFQSFWEPELKARGYAALYKQRTQVSGNKKDGTQSDATAASKRSTSAVL